VTNADTEQEPIRVPRHHTVVGGGPEVLAVLGSARGPAEESTFRRAFALVSARFMVNVPRSVARTGSFIKSNAAATG
jgi:hypothetical protein